MKKYLLGAAALALLAANAVPAGQGVTPVLRMDTTYHFILGSGFVPTAPFVERVPGTLYALVWQGTVQGDVEGVIRWWGELTPAGEFTSVGKWEIWDCMPEYPSPGCDFDSADQLIMAGYETFGYVSATDWEGKGIVTYANEEYAEWFGRRTTDGGYVDFVGGYPSYGEGYFTIYNRPSNKH
jgi:hypothetical protein